MGDHLADGFRLTTETTSSTSVVSWQTAVRTLIPALTNILTQPCGRLLNIDVALSSQLRISPMYCAVDSLSVIVRTITLSCERSVSPWAALRVVASSRWQEDVANADRDNILERLKAGTILRWVLFILGTLPSTLKLLALGGIPWTQAYGISYCISFLIVEILIASAGTPIPLHAASSPAPVIAPPHTVSIDSPTADATPEEGMELQLMRPARAMVLDGAVLDSNSARARIDSLPATAGVILTPSGAFDTSAPVSRMIHSSLESLERVRISFRRWARA